MAPRCWLTWLSLRLAGHRSRRGPLRRRQTSPVEESGNPASGGAQPTLSRREIVRLTPPCWFGLNPPIARAGAHTADMSRGWFTGPIADARWSRLTTAVGLAAYVVVVYAVIVLGGGALMGRTGSPSLSLSLLATVVVALTFERVRRWTESASARMFHRSGSSPYDVLSHFSETVTGGYATEELPARMAKLLAEGTNAEWAEVWLTVQDRLVLEASWPAGSHADEQPLPASGARDLTGAGRRALTVRHGGQIYGIFRPQEHPGVALSTVEERLFTGLAAQAGLVLRLVGL